jgi:hypothetical protein
MGYISFSALKEIKMEGWIAVDCEPEPLWKIKQASKIKKINF